jgi:hypothetical protein
MFHGRVPAARYRKNRGEQGGRTMPVLMRQPAAKAPWPPRPENDTERREPRPVAVGSDPKQNFWTIAAENGLDPRELLFYNFQTRDMQEINWYLKEYVGCTRTTSDGFNYVLLGAASDPVAMKGMIFVPVRD